MSDDLELRIYLIGEYGVGKKSIIKRFKLVNSSKTYEKSQKKNSDDENPQNEDNKNNNNNENENENDENDDNKNNLYNNNTNNKELTPEEKEFLHKEKLRQNLINLSNLKKKIIFKIFFNLRINSIR